MADSLCVSPITGLYRRFAELIHELAKFGLVGAIAAVLDLGGAAALHGAAGLGPLVAKTISTVAAATFAYAGNRIWTFRHRANAGLAREYLIFFVLNGIGLLIALLVIGFTEYSLGLHGLLAYNVAQVTGTAIGTIFRYWAYKKWVFLPHETPGTQVPGPQPPLPTRARVPAHPMPQPARALSPASARGRLADTPGTRPPARLRGPAVPVLTDVHDPDPGEPVGVFFTPVR
jgi:putative flippase GtrA